MDIIGSAAAVAQLLGQAIKLWQQVNQARQIVRDGPKLLEEYQKQLETLANTARLVEAEKELQTAEIGAQLIRVEEIAQELYEFLESMSVYQEKGKVKKYLRAIGTGEQNAKEIRGILQRLAEARTDLSIRIQLAHVGLSGSLRDGFVAVIPTIQRIDESLQKVLNMRLAVAVQLEPKLASQRDDHTVLLNVDEQKALGLKTDHLTIQDNSTLENAAQHNAIAGTEGSQVFIKAAISQNVAKGYGKQRNSIGDATESGKLSNSKDG